MREVIPQFSPMRLALRREPFDHPDWLYELKYDGFRALLITENGAARLVSRNGNVYKSFPRLADEIGLHLSGFDGTILDGEIVCLDTDGRPQFEQLFRRRGEPYFYAFDLLFLGDRDLRALPLTERKRALRDVVPRSDSRLLYANHVDSNG